LIAVLPASRAHDALPVEKASEAKSGNLKAEVTGYGHGACSPRDLRRAITSCTRSGQADVVSRETFLSGWGRKPYKAEDSGFFFNLVRSIDLSVQFREGCGGTSMAQPVSGRYPRSKICRPNRGCQMGWPSRRCLVSLWLWQYPGHKPHRP
jgi:hypothetical protein